MPYRLLEDIALNTETLGAKGNFLCTVQLLGFFGPQESESSHLGEQILMSHRTKGLSDDPPFLCSPSTQ